MGLVLIQAALPRSVRKSCPSMYETLDALKNVPEAATAEDFLADAVLKLGVTEDDMEKENRKQLVRRRAKRSEGTDGKRL